MMLTPEEWVRAFVGQGRSRAEIIEAAWDKFGWSPHTVDDAIAAAADAGSIEAAEDVFANGFMRGAATSVDRAFRKRANARWKARR